MTMTIKPILYTFGAIFVVMMLTILSIGLSGNKTVPKTVVDDMSLPSIEIGGIKLHAETFGNSDNPMIVVIHGGPGGDYRHLLDLKVLSDEYFVVFYDQRSAGLSQRVSSEELTLDSHREELHQIIKYYENDKPIYLIGHSWGAMLGTYYLSKYGETMDKAILAEPGFLNKQFFVEFYEKTNGLQPEDPSLSMGINVLKAIIRSKFVFGPDPDAGEDYLIAGITNSSSTESPIAGYFCDNDTRNAVLPYWRYGAKSMNILNSLISDYKEDQVNFSFDLTVGLENYQKPVLIVAGECNNIIGPELQKRQANLFPNAQVSVIEEAGHTMFGEKPEQSVQIIRGFLKKTD